MARYVGVGRRVTRDGEGNGMPLLWRDAGMAQSLSGSVGIVSYFNGVG